MASNFVPFFQGTDATKLINNYLGENITADTPMTPADMNANNVFRNPYSPEGFYANDTDKYPVDSYTPPVTDDEGIPNCPEGYIYDEVLKACRFVGFSEPAQEDSDREETDTRTFSEKEYDKMRRSSDNPFGANIQLDKYSVGFDADGNEIFEFKEKPPIGLIGIFDAIFGGNARREKKYNDAMATILGQTQSDFYKNANPFAFGYQNGNQFTKFSDQNYLNRVQDEIVRGSNQGATMGELLGSVGQGTAPINQGGQGTQTSDDSNYMVQNDGKRDESAYGSAIAKNIARNLSNMDSTTGQKKSTASTGSGFSKSLGGFYKGR